MRTDRAGIEVIVAKAATIGNGQRAAAADAMAAVIAIVVANVDAIRTGANVRRAEMTMRRAPKVIVAKVKDVGAMDTAARAIATVTARTGTVVTPIDARAIDRMSVRLQIPLVRTTS